MIWFVRVFLPDHKDTQNLLKPEPKYSPEAALIKLRRYCAYQERCHQEVKLKLASWFIYGQEQDRLTAQLIDEGFLNEERFAKAWAGGKFRTKGWGKKKIVNILKQKGISEYLIRVSLKEIEDKDYGLKLEALIQKKHALMKDEQAHIQKQKLARFAIGKGYEPDAVWELVNRMV